MFKEGSQGYHDQVSQLNPPLFALLATIATDMNTTFPLSIYIDYIVSYTYYSQANYQAKAGNDVLKCVRTCVSSVCVRACTQMLSILIQHFAKESF